MVNNNKIAALITDSVMKIISLILIIQCVILLFRGDNLMATFEFLMCAFLMVSLKYITRFFEMRATIEETVIKIYNRELILDRENPISKGVKFSP